MFDLQRSVNDAIFVLQLNTQDAVKYVVKHSHVSPREASDAISSALKWYKR